MRWHYRDGGLLWPFVPAYVIHVAEEWFAGFPQWIERFAGRPLPDVAFVSINAVALALLIAGIRAATRHEDSGWIAVAVATIALVNMMVHVAGAAFTQSYSPGLVSAVVLYVPLATLTMIRALDQAPREHLMRGIAAGLLLHAAVSLVAFASSRL